LELGDGGVKGLSASVSVGTRTGRLLDGPPTRPFFARRPLVETLVCTPLTGLDSFQNLRECNLLFLCRCVGESQSHRSLRLLALHPSLGLLAHLYRLLALLCRTALLLHRLLCHGCLSPLSLW